MLKAECKNQYVEPKIHGFMDGKNPPTAEIPATRMVPFFCFNVFIGYADLVSGVIRRSLVLPKFGSSVRRFILHRLIWWDSTFYLSRKRKRTELLTGRLMLAVGLWLLDAN